MSGLIKNVMEFETRMDRSLKIEISVLFSLIEYQSRGCTRCELRKAGGFNGWLVECNWSDEESMHTHFQSAPSQDLIWVIACRSSSIRFQSIVGAVAGAYQAPAGGLIKNPR